jgi:hypothetical protein
MSLEKKEANPALVEGKGQKALNGTSVFRAYTVHELDALRRAVEDRWLFGSSVPSRGWRMSRQHRAEEKAKCVEELVRTHMQAGHTAQDLLNEDKNEAEP